MGSKFMPQAIHIFLQRTRNPDTAKQEVSSLPIKQWCWQGREIAADQSESFATHQHFPAESMGCPVVQAVGQLIPETARLNHASVWNFRFT